MRTDLNKPLRNSLKTCVNLLTEAMKINFFKGIQSEPAPDTIIKDMPLACQLRRFRINSKNNSICCFIKGSRIGGNFE